MPTTLAAALALTAATPKLVAIHGSYQHVLCFATHSGVLFAGTDSGLLRRGAERWEPFFPILAGCVVRFDGRFATLATGKRYELAGDSWNPATDVPPPAPPDEVATLGPDGTLSLKPDGVLAPLGSGGQVPGPPALATYALHEFGGVLFAGTSEGIYARREGAWKAEAVPGRVPTARFQAASIVGGTWVAGGPEGLYTGSPGAWRQWDARPVRGIAVRGQEPWALFGDGSVDKLSLPTLTRVPNVLLGAVKRPWTSCLGLDGDTLLFGGAGGWVEKSPTGTKEIRPKALQAEVVTAIGASRGTTWVGTQQGGMYSFGKQAGHWSYVEGLKDCWVTCLLPGVGGSYLGTASGGLYEVRAGAAKPVPAPSQRITCLAEWRGNLIVGAMDGAWIRMRGEWTALTPNPVEVTCVAVDSDRLHVATAHGTILLQGGAR